MASDFRLKEQLPELTERIVQTYTEIGSINHLGHCPLPNYEVIISSCEDLKEDPLPRLPPPRRTAPGQCAAITSAT